MCLAPKMILCGQDMSLAAENTACKGKLTLYFYLCTCNYILFYLHSWHPFKLNFTFITKLDSTWDRSVLKVYCNTRMLF